MYKLFFTQKHGWLSQISKRRKDPKECLTYNSIYIKFIHGARSWGNGKGTVMRRMCSKGFWCAEITWSDSFVCDT